MGLLKCMLNSCLFSLGTLNQTKSHLNRYSNCVNGLWSVTQEVNLALTECALSLAMFALLHTVLIALVGCKLAGLIWPYWNLLIFRPPIFDMGFLVVYIGISCCLYFKVVLKRLIFLCRIRLKTFRWHS